MRDVVAHRRPILSTLNRREPLAHAIAIVHHCCEARGSSTACSSRETEMTKHPLSSFSKYRTRMQRGTTHRAIATLITLVTGALAVFGAGCVKRQQTPDAASMRLVEQESSSGVVAIATTMADSPSHITLCSGALVAPNLILTARHCVSRAVTATPSCDARGRSHNGDHLAEDVDPSSIAIYIGSHVRPDVDVPVARAVRTLHPTGQVLCDADVAFLVLDRPIPNATILSMRLQARSRPVTRSCRSASAAASRTSSVTRSHARRARSSRRARARTPRPAPCSARASSRSIARRAVVTRAARPST